VGAGTAGNGMLEAVEQQAAIGKASQRVKKCQLVKLLADIYMLGDIGGDPAQRIDAVVGIAQRQFHRQKGMRDTIIPDRIDFLFHHLFTLFDNAQVIALQRGGGLRIEQCRVAHADNLLLRHSQQITHMAVGILVAKIAVLDVDMGLDAVKNGIEERFTGTQIAGFLCHFAAQ